MLFPGHTPIRDMHTIFFFNSIRVRLYQVLKAKIDSTLILQSANSCESGESPAEKHAYGCSEPRSHILYFVR